MQILPAIRKDVPALNRLVNSAYRGESSKQGWTHEADYLGGIRTTEASLSEMIEKPNVTILKAEENEQLIACVYLEKKEKALYLGMLTVDPTLQAKGTGKILMEVAENFAKENDCTSIELSVVSRRSELIAYYERRGYVLTGKKQPFPMNDPNFGEPKVFLEFVEMQKKLS